MERKEKIAKSNSEKYRSITDLLPVFMDRFFYSGLKDKSIHTKLAYARDIYSFMQFVSEEYFDGRNVKDISLADMESITATHFDSYIKQMEENKMATKSIARVKTAMQQIYIWLINENKLRINPIAGARRIRVESSSNLSYLTLEEQERLIASIMSGNGLSRHHLIYHEQNKLRNLAIVSLILDTGLRLSEIQSLNVGDINSYENYDKEGNEHCLYVIRRGNPVAISFTDQAYKYIEEYLISRKNQGEGLNDNDPLFTVPGGARLSAREIQHMVKRYVELFLERKDISVNDLRASAAIAYYIEKRNLKLLKERLDISSSTACKYVELAEQYDHEYIAYEVAGNLRTH